MSRIAICAAAILVVAASAPAAGKSTDKRVEAALACASITDDGPRLKCFDTAVANLKVAVETGTLVAEKTMGDPSGFEGIIRSSASSGFNRARLTLDNGDRWEVIANSSNDPLPRTGAKVKLKKSPAGGYWFIEPGSADRRARFLGRSTS